MKLSMTDNPFRGTTKYLLFCCSVFAWGDILFGIDTGSFGSIQALPAWLRQFGEPNEKGVYALTTSRQSIMNSVVWPGKLAGVAAFEPIAHRFGYKISIYIVAFVQIVALILEMTAKSWIQFTIGRIVAYFGVGIVENAAPMYMAEIAPAPMRGALAGLVQVLASLGNLWGAGMGRAYATELDKKGWLIPVGVQLIPAILLIALTPFTVESPRWLMSHGRREQAQASLDKLRSPHDVQHGITEAEIEAIHLSFEESRLADQVSWLTLFKGTYLRRLCIGPVLFFFQQTNGGQFLLSYAPTFYKSLGLGTLAFTYNIVGLVVGVAGTMTYILTVDLFGRRTFAMLGTFGATVTEFIATGILVTKKRANSAEVGLVIACLSLFQFCTKIGLSGNAWVICTETAGVRMRQKLIAYGTAIDVLAAFVVTFTYPYIANPQGANLGTKTGWIFSSISATSFIFTVLMVPELKGRSLEEVDELFEQRLWAWQFKHANTHGVGATMRQLESGVSVEQAKAVPETEDAHRDLDKT